MPVTPDEARVLAKQAADHRPSGAPRWPADETFHVLAKLRDRHFVDVALALFRAVDDREARSAAVLLSPQSQHWRERGSDRPTPTTRTDPAHLCGTCSLTQAECERRWSEDHDFQAVHQLKARLSASHLDVERTVAELKSLGVVPPEPKPERVVEPTEVPEDYAAARAQLTAPTDPRTPTSTPPETEESSK